MLLALELDDYRALPTHDDGWLADRLCLPLPMVQRCLSTLADFGQIRRAGRLWQRQQIQTVDARTPARSLDLKRWWAEVALQRLAHPGLLSYNLCTVSHEDYERIRALQREHFREVRGIVSRSERSERLVLMNFQTLTLDHPPEGDDQGSSRSTNQGQTT